MKLKICDHPLINIIKLPGLPHIYDVEMRNLELLKKLSSFECHLVVYPYDRELNSDHIAFNPYEEYVTDVSQNQRSSYSPILNRFNKFFGIIFGLIIVVIFALFKPEELFSVESLVSIFGAYAIGQAIWDDVESLLVDLSKKLRVRYMERYYRYRIEKNTTLTNYMHYAKAKRYRKNVLPAEKIDFIKQSNSQTLRLFYKLKDLKALINDEAFLFSIHIDKGCLKYFLKSGFLLGIKLSFNKHFFFWHTSCELFQSNDSGENGCLDKHNNWQKQAVFYRRTVSVGRLKFFISSGVLENKDIINVEV